MSLNFEIYFLEFLWEMFLVLFQASVDIFSFQEM